MKNEINQNEIAQNEMNKKALEKIRMSDKMRKIGIKGGRPSKMTEKFLNIAKSIMAKGLNAIIYTDAELLRLINMQLSENEKVTHSRWEDWKAGKVKDRNGLLERFQGIARDSLLIQKANLFKKFEDDQKTWTKWSWIIERKFSEWNLKKISETTVNQTVTLQLEEQKEIDNLLGIMSIGESSTAKGIEADYVVEDDEIAEKVDNSQISSQGDELPEVDESVTASLFDELEPAEKVKSKVMVEDEIDKLW